METQTVTALITGLKEAGINFVASLTSTGIKHFLPSIMDDPYFEHVPVANESDGINICAGAWLGGKNRSDRNNNCLCMEVVPKPSRRLCRQVRRPRLYCLYRKGFSDRSFTGSAASRLTKLLYICWTSEW